MVVSELWSCYDHLMFTSFAKILPWSSLGCGWIMVMVITDISWPPHGDGPFPDSHHLILSGIYLIVMVISWS